VVCLYPGFDQIQSLPQFIRRPAQVSQFTAEPDGISLAAIPFGLRQLIPHLLLPGRRLDQRLANLFQLGLQARR
jgi:hypothetical protein